MGREPILDAKKKKIGYIETRPNGNSVITDIHFRKLGELKVSGNRIEAYNAKFQKLGYYDKPHDATFDRSFKKLGKGNLLLNFFF